MRINHNIQALNAYRNLSQTMASTSKSLEKLSSGLRINRASDDAAGLAISEKMRSQIRGLDMAERNSLDAVSLIQTGEGALSETHSILQRMRELSVQAANGTLEDTDREAIQKEVDQLTFEIDRIADNTQFNQKKLFSGSEKGRAFAEISSDQVKYTGAGTWSGEITAEPTEPAKVDMEFSNKPVSLTFSEVPKVGDKLDIDQLTIEFGDTASSYSAGRITIDITGKDLKTVLDEINGAITAAETDVPSRVPAVSPTHTVIGTTLSLGTVKTDDGSNNGLNIKLFDGDVEANRGKELSLLFQVGANEGEGMELSLGIMDAASLGLARTADRTTPLTAGVNAEAGVNVSTTEAASAAITLIDHAIRRVSEERSKLGAIQNRLEHTVANLQSANENLTSAESRIRDLDMAKEMSNFTKNNILNQAGQAMLAQSNQLPQGILQLLNS